MSFSYSICSRETKKGTVYDARFRVVDGRGIERQKRLCGFKTKGEAKKAAVKFLSTYVPEAPPAPTLDAADKMPFEKALAAYNQARERNCRHVSFRRRSPRCLTVHTQSPRPLYRAFRRETHPHTRLPPLVLRINRLASETMAQNWHRL